MGFHRQQKNRTASRGRIQVREAHYREHFGPSSEPIMHSGSVDPVHIDIYRFGPTATRPHWTLATWGMSDSRQYLPGCGHNTDFRAELLMYVRNPEDWMFKALKRLAEIPFRYKTHFNWFHTVPFGESVMGKQSELSAFLFLMPCFEKPEILDLRIDGDPVKFLLVVPITERERQYAQRNGSEALEKLFTARRVLPVVDETRESLV